MNTRREYKIACILSQNARIKEFVVDTIDQGQSVNQSNTLYGLFIEQDKSKTDSFLELIKVDNYAFGWMINIKMQDKAEPLYFAGSLFGDEIIVLGAKSRTKLIRLYEQLKWTGNQRIQNLIKALEKGIEDASKELSKESAVYDELMFVMNDLVNTQRQLAQKNQMIQEERAKYIATLSSIGDAVISTDQKGIIIFVNKIAELLTRWRKEDLIGRKIDEFRFLHEAKNSPAIKEYMNKLKGVSSTIRLCEDCFLKSKDGFNIPISGNLSTIKTEEDKIIGYVLVFHDETERRQLIKSQTQISEILKLINKILRHDIRNKLVVANFALEKMQKSEDNEMILRATNALDTIENIITRMYELEKTVSLGGLLEEVNVRDIVETITEQYDFDIEVEGEGIILADKAIDTVFENIIGNAIIHSKTDSILVKIEKIERYCLIRVMDWGKGIPEKYKARIFNEGFKFGETGQTGIGLYIVKKVIERYNGEIWMENNEPTGTVFNIKLPSPK